MMRESLVACTLGLCSIALAGCTSQPAAPSIAPGSAAATLATDSRAGGPGIAGGVYVTSQGLCYDTFVASEQLPMRGPFQRLYPDGSTEFGPGDPGYLGGRWWQDLNGNEMPDEGDRFFLCPLLPPGRAPVSPGNCG